MATEHLKACVRTLVDVMHDTDNHAHPHRHHLTEGFAAVFELIDQPWDFSGDKDVLTWRDGYETCMKDIVDAIADEWGVQLPDDPTRSTHGGNDAEGAGQ